MKNLSWRKVPKTTLVKWSTGLFIAMWHGLTALHIANDPGLPPGSRRFGSLVPAALKLIQTSWQKYPAQRNLPS